MTSGEDYAKIRELAARLGIPAEEVERYLSELMRHDIESSVELRPAPISPPVPQARN